MKLCYIVSAQELINAGAPLSVIRQSYRACGGFKENVVEVQPITGVKDGKIVYACNGSSKDNTFYTVPAKKLSDGALIDATATGSTATLVYKNSIKDSYVLIGD